MRAADTSVDPLNPTNLQVGLSEGQLAPDFEVSTLEGERVRLSDFRGHAVYLNFWASWCGPCKAEMPDIQHLLNTYGTGGLVVLAVNNGETYGTAQGFVEDLGLDFTEFALDPSRKVIDRYRILSMPTSIFLDSHGVITQVHFGFATAGQMDDFAREALGLGASTYPPPR